MALLTHNQNLGNVTSASVDTTGGTLLIVTIDNFGATAAGVTVSDSKGNSWHALTDHTQSNNHVTTWYAWDHGGTALSVGSGHTVTMAGASSLVEWGFLSFSGTRTSSTPFLSETGSNSVGSTLQTGLITPSGSGDLIVSVYGSNQSTGVQSIDSSFNLIDHIIQNAGVNAGHANAYLISGGSAVNPTWTSSGGSGNQASHICCFKAAPSGSLFQPSPLTGLGTGGPFFPNPIG